MIGKCFYDFLDIGVIAIVVQLQQKNDITKKDRTVINCIITL